MSRIWYLSLKHALYHRAQTVILILCIAVSIFVPTSAQYLMVTYKHDLTSRAQITPLIAGAKGNRFDLTLSTLYFRQSNIQPIPLSIANDIKTTNLGLTIPINTNHTAQDFPIIGTTLDYLDMRHLTVAQGTLPLQLGDVILGSNVAKALQLQPDDHLFSDQKEIYDISKPPALKMHITGILAESGTPDDDAIFVDIKTVWIIEGLSHGHQDVTKKIDPALIIGRSDELIAVSEALIEYNEVTPENIASFHIHGDPSTLPLTSIIVIPHDQKSATILEARINESALYQMVTPSRVIADLMSFVFRIKSLFDTLSIVLAASTALMTVLVVLLSMKIRAREMHTLNRIGCSRFAVVQLHTTELAFIITVSIALSLVGLWLVNILLPNLITVL